MVMENKQKWPGKVMDFPFSFFQKKSEIPALGLKIISKWYLFSLSYLFTIHMFCIKLPNYFSRNQMITLDFVYNMPSPTSFTINSSLLTVIKSPGRSGGKFIFKYFILNFFTIPKEKKKFIRWIYKHIEAFISFSSALV